MTRRIGMVAMARQWIRNPLPSAVRAGAVRPDRELPAPGSPPV